MFWGTNRELWFVILVISLFILLFPELRLTSCRYRKRACWNHTFQHAFFYTGKQYGSLPGEKMLFVVAQPRVG